MLILKDITKRYTPLPFWLGGKKSETRGVLQGVSLTVNPGEIVGIQGENGSGKTTLLKIIAGWMYPDGGKLFYDSYSFPQDETIWRSFTRYLDTQSRSFYGRLTVGFNVKLFLALYGEKPDPELLHLFGVDPLLNQPFHSLSAGEKQRVSLLRAIHGSARLYVLDEPFLSLDEKGMLAFSTWVKELRNKDSIVFITFCKEEKEMALCDRVLTLQRGRLS